MSAILTLEPLLEAIREGMDGAGWALSGLQKTTSHQFEGRWEGEHTRSAYLFFHRDDLPDGVSIDVFLDESSKGLRGNFALVIDGPDLGESPDVSRTLSTLSEAAGAVLPEGFRSPITLRLWLEGRESPPGEAESEYRFKLHIPTVAVEAGPSAIVALTSTFVKAFEALVLDSRMQMYVPKE
jgi:hypothetical protein